MKRTKMSEENSVKLCFVIDSLKRTFYETFRRLPNAIFIPNSLYEEFIIEINPIDCLTAIPLGTVYYKSMRVVKTFDFRIEVGLVIS